MNEFVSSSSGEGVTAVNAEGEVPAGAVGVVGSGDSSGGGCTVEYNFVFLGRGWEFFRIWLVNVLLTVATLGIYSAWAKVRTRRYFYGNTLVDGASFEYHASPWSILVARVLVVVVLVGGAVWAGEDILRNAAHSLLLVLLVPWAIVRGFAFNARYSSYRNVRFGFVKNARVYGRAYLIYLPVILLVLIQYMFVSAAGNFTSDDIDKIGLGMATVMGVLFLGVFAAAPWMQRGYHALKARNHRWGRTVFGFEAPSIGFYLAVFWGLPVFVLLLWGAATGLTAGWFVADPLTVVDSGWGDVAVPVALYTAVTFVGLATIFVAGAWLFKLYWRGVRVLGDGRMECRFSALRFGVVILMRNYFAVLFSFGLLYPWTRVRRARFLADHMVLVLPAGVLDEALDEMARGEGALGQEFDAAGFEFDVGLI